MVTAFAGCGILIVAKHLIHFEDDSWQNTVMSNFLRFLVVLLPLLMCRCATAQETNTKPLRAFISKYCVDCHGADATERVQLQQLNLEATSDLAENRWLQILRKLQKGEMPPKDELQPSDAERKRVVAAISKSLEQKSVKRQKDEGRVVLRRLNRVEYQNTINDLFAINVDVKDILPEDSTAHGFDNIGSALNISSVLLERYLEAVDIVLDAAIETGERPKTSKRQFSYKEERRVKNHKSYLPVDDGLVFFSSGYSPTEINQFRAPILGDYRIRVSAYAYQSDQPVTYRVYGGIGIKRHLVGYAQAGLKPTIAEFTTRLGSRNTLRVVPYGTWLTKWNQAANEKNPGLAVQWVEIEGPLIEKWPPESHRRLFGDAPIEVINAEEIKRNRRLQPDRQVVSFDVDGDARSLLTQLLPKIFRRKITDADVEPYLQIILAGISSGYSYQNAVRVGLKAALCSPDFLYFKERRGQPLDDFQLANRLSYFLWSSMPDDELFALAAEGKLHDTEALQQQTERMLKDSRSQRFTENFVGQWLDLREIDFTTPDRLLYPEYDELLKISMVSETQLFFNELLENDLSVLNVVDSDFAMLNQRLARHYGIDGVKGQEFQKVNLPKTSIRGGVLTQASVLKVTANGTNTSPVLRGVWVLENILGQPTPPPPANVPAVEPDIRGAKSIREQLAKHREISSCATCHRHIDPVGFALENFDVIGGWRKNYRSIGAGERSTTIFQGRGVRYKVGLPVDAADSLANGNTFGNIEEFKRVLLKNPDGVVRCVAEKLLTYATGSGIQFADHKHLDGIIERTKLKDHGLRSLIHEVVQSNIFLNK